MLILVSGAAAMQAQTLPVDRARRQQQVQRQVRTMARQLVGSVLDLQLQQLRENGLTSHPWYNEIRTMREHLDEMVESEMSNVIAMLSKIDTEDEAQRDKVFRAAREKSRDIVIRLLVERQTLLRRLKIAEMAARVRQLIELETKVLMATLSLPEQPTARRQALNLTAIEDQRDVKATYLQFKEALAEVSHWPPPLGEEAAEGLRKLTENRVDEELVAAETHLQGAAFAEAATSQKTVIRGLQALLLQMQHAQKIAERQNDALGQKIRELIEKQEEIQKATQQNPLDKQAEVEKLTSKQTEVRKAFR